LKKIQDHLVVVKQKLEEEDQQKNARKRLQDFQAPYHKALFFHTLFTELDPAANQANTRDAARTALTIYGLDGEGGAANGAPTLLERDQAYYPGEHTRLVGACYELLLIWAEAEAAAPQKPSRQQADKALALLDRAAKLGKIHGLKTRTYHLLQARFLAQSKGELFDLAVAEQTAPRQPLGRLDWFLTGLEEYRKHAWAKSIVACDQVLQQQSDDFWAHYLKALCQLRLGQWIDAKAELTVCLNLRADFVLPRVLRGFATSEVGARHTDQELAQAEFSAADHDFAAALAALKRDPDPLVQYLAWNYRGLLDIRRKYWDQAVEELQAAVKVLPDWVEGYLNLAKAYEGKQRWKEALEALDQAVKRAPLLPDLYERRAELHWLRKDWPAAQADFQKATQLREPEGSKSKELVNNLEKLGLLLHRAEKYPEALGCFDRALQLKPGRVLVQRFRAETLVALVLRAEAGPNADPVGRVVPRRVNLLAEAGQALDHYLAKTKPLPDDVYKVYHLRGLIYTKTGHVAEALTMYTLALAEQPNDEEMLCERGWTYLMKDAVRLALDDFEACLSAEETNLDALIGRGNARIRLLQLDGALDDAWKVEALTAANQTPLDARLSYNLARLYAQAAGQMELQPRTGKKGKDQEKVQRLALCKAKAWEHLQQALEQNKTAQRQAAFWHEQIEMDPAFLAIRSGNEYAKLAKRYGGKG
jgi:tetratricopeptide (TPR) repeat protein